MASRYKSTRAIPYLTRDTARFHLKTPKKTYRHEDTNRLASSGQNANDVWRLDFFGSVIRRQTAPILILLRKCNRQIDERICHLSAHRQCTES
ncbi:hypothetical protein Sputw3181_1080 [Shewanella sp. W3-18-1]|nr:hypothetical protein Sputw3181_1080 [Shewanella sp. W3-18-1]